MIDKKVLDNSVRADKYIKNTVWYKIISGVEKENLALSLASNYRWILVSPWSNLFGILIYLTKQEARWNWKLDWRLTI